MYGLIGVVIGLLINWLIIQPIEKRKIRKECIEKGLIPKGDTAERR